MLDPRLEVTGFGAYPHRFAALVDIVSRRSRPVSIISAACHNGAETYSAAMYLHDAGIAAQIVAHDGDAGHHERAVCGEYLRTEIEIDFAMGRLPQRFRRYFVPCVDPDRLTIREDIRAMVDVALSPRLLPRDGIASADVIMIRNAWVHLRPGQRLDLLGRLRSALNPSGVIFTRSNHRAEMSAACPELTAQPIGRSQHIYGRPWPDFRDRLAPIAMAPAVDPLPNRAGSRD
ncbi:CheR family methyltransferase [Nocardia sp. NPDC051981]|uniref:CheR family methyltransferase n=1 Tax=Nocardia sp. NPDC051981 TaxID=3155417 RepID=UPI00341AC02D